MLRGKKKTSTEQESSPMNGIGRKKVEHGTASTQESKLSCQNSMFANGVVKSSTNRLVASTNSAQTSAKQPHVTTLELTTKQDSASGVEKNSLSTSTVEHNTVAKGVQDNTMQACELIGIEVISEEEQNVYDIEVDDMHEFFANGILVHNCVDATRYYTLSVLLGKVMKPRNINKSDLGIW